MLADERVEQAGLADAVAAEHAGHLAGLGGERDAAQRLRGAVVQIDGVDFAAWCYRPRYTSITRSFVRDLIDRAFGQHRAFVQARDLDAELAHEGHVVLDHDHGAVAVDLLQQLGGLPRLGVGHAGDRLVDQQQLRLLRQQHADLEPLLLAVRQAAGDALAHASSAG